MAGAITGAGAALKAKQANQAYSDFQTTDSWSDAQQLYDTNHEAALQSTALFAVSAGLVLGAWVTGEW